MFSLKRFFIPYNKFSIKILTIISESTSDVTMADIYKGFDNDPALGKIHYYLERMKAKGVIEVQQTFRASKPKYPRYLYSLTNLGRTILEEENAS